MKIVAAFFQIILFLASAFIVHAQSLADLAKKEKERRSRITKARVITVEEAAKYITKPNPSATKKNSEEKAGESEAESKAEKPDLDEPVDFQGRPESYWRQTMAEARQRVQDLENEKNVLILKQNRLENEFHGEDNGFRRETIQREIQKTFYEQDLNKENLEKAKAALEDLEKEARKSGALPGWISEPRIPLRPQKK
jgi:hypothetical protein